MKFTITCVHCGAVEKKVRRTLGDYVGPIAWFNQTPEEIGWQPSVCCSCGEISMSIEANGKMRSIPLYEGDYFKLRKDPDWLLAIQRDRMLCISR